uniref:Rhodanese domain-containing protein n=1 Tax=Kalanchoe fedtschenkoi TaxID=63787 RepID=A0A7N0UYP9_KALFE
MAEIGVQNDEYGVLLYYKYVVVPDVDRLVRFYESNCGSLALLGRVRLSPQGVNVTVGGKLYALEKHIEEVKSSKLFEGTDFKLASCHHPANDKVAKECGFTSLSIRIVKELVTLTSHPQLDPPMLSNVGKHLSAHEFHSVLHSANDFLVTQRPDCSKKVVLLDARNLYETRIGKFSSPNVETMDPKIRQYSDLPTWIDRNSEKLKGKHVLMYCTGGIRCEMASAYLKSKGAGFENVYQLYGGIQRYLENFPGGGFFKGKNFVFDHRMAVESSDNSIMGTCLLCGSSYDDYSARCRCTYCRMLVLVCDRCQGEKKKTDVYICELCKKHGKVIASVTPVKNNNVELMREFESLSTSDILPSVSSHHLVSKVTCSRKLKVLCLHGFRQNASGFKGRTASLAKKLKNLAELVFVDAPHELSFFYQPTKQVSLQKPLFQPDPPPLDKCTNKFAWLVAPNTINHSETGWKLADSRFDPLQYEQQTEGLDISFSYLKSKFSQEGPFDGILGFSQGAAMAALLCARREMLSEEISFRFAILCSGFAVQLSEVKPNSINCPSLHIYGSDQDKDRQIARQSSSDLAALFEKGCSDVIQHDSGHIIPTRSPYIDQVKSFLRRFQ